MAASRSLEAVPPTDAGGRLTLEIPDPGNEGPHHLEIELDCGHIYHAMVARASVREDVIERMAGMRFAAVVPANGGLIGNLKVWENLVLPVAYHGSARYDELERRAAGILAEFGVPGERFEALCTALPNRLDRFERRLFGFVRAMLTEPRLMVYDSLFDGLAREETGKVLAFDQAYRSRFPSGTSLYLTADLPGLPEVGAHRTFHL